MAVVATAGGMVVEEGLDRLRIEELGRAKGRIEESFPEVCLQGAAEPAVDRDAETPLWPVEELRRQDACNHLPQYVLAVTAGAEL